MLALVTLLFANQASAQLMIDNTLTPEQLVQNVLVGSGVSAFNITFTGDSQAHCYFSNGNSTNLGLDEGVILSSGNASEASNPAADHGSPINRSASLLRFSKAAPSQPVIQPSCGR